MWYDRCSTRKTRCTSKNMALLRSLTLLKECVAKFETATRCLSEAEDGFDDQVIHVHNNMQANLASIACRIAQLLAVLTLPDASGVFVRQNVGTWVELNRLLQIIREQLSQLEQSCNCFRSNQSSEQYQMYAEMKRILLEFGDAYSDCVKIVNPHLFVGAARADLQLERDNHNLHNKLSAAASELEISEKLYRETLDKLKNRNYNNQQFTIGIAALQRSIKHLQDQYTSVPLLEKLERIKESARDLESITYQPSIDGNESAPARVEALQLQIHFIQQHEIKLAEAAAARTAEAAEPPNTAQKPGKSTKKHTFTVSDVDTPKT